MIPTAPEPPVRASEMAHEYQQVLASRGIEMSPEEVGRDLRAFMRHEEALGGDYFEASKYYPGPCWRTDPSAPALTRGTFAPLEIA